MRIIAGTARGTRLATLKGEATRPTLERVKEGMFSAVQFWLPGASVLDLFAGSGQLGLEALSRGAANCTFVDESPQAVALVRQNAQAAGLFGSAKVVRGDATAFLARTGDRFDLILIDPPYGGVFFPGGLALAARAAAAGGLVLCETDAQAELPDQCEGLTLQKRYRYGTVAISRYKMAEDEDG